MSAWIWGTMLVIGLAFEAYAIWSKKQGDTLSEHTRRVFFVNTKAGRAVFTVFWAGFSVWFLLHIVTGAM